MTNDNIKNQIVAFLLAAFIVYLGLCLLGCASQPEVPVQTVSAPREFSPRCAEVAEEVPQMRAWCNSTMIAPSRARESCRFVADYERTCQ